MAAPIPEKDVREEVLDDVLSALLDAMTAEISKEGVALTEWDIEGAEINDDPDGPELLIVRNGQMFAIKAELI